MEQDYIYIKGAKEHNLKNISLRIPRNKLVVVTGLSGSGKSSLAFDTIYAEGQRRYVESLSSYARQFLEQLQKPNVDFIEGLSPSISIEQRTAGSNPRSTVGTTTEIYDYLRLLFAKVGVPHCYKCGRPITQQTPEQIVDKIMELSAGARLLILAPVVRGRKGEYNRLFAEILKEGFTRVRVDGRFLEIEDIIQGQDRDLPERKTSRVLDKKRKHSIEIVVDRLIVSDNIKKRLTDSVETALKAGNGVVSIVKGRLFEPPPAPGMKPRAGTATDTTGKPVVSSAVENSKGKDQEFVFSRLYACVKCGINFEELTPRMFSFNSPYGACPVCSGLGTKMEIDPELVIRDKSKAISEGAIEPWRRGGHRVILYYRALLRELSGELNFSLETPFNKLSRDVQQKILYGCDTYVWGKPFEGVIPNLLRRFAETESDFVRDEIHKYMSAQPCLVCQGRRLRPESLAVLIAGKSIMDITAMTVSQANNFFKKLQLDRKHMLVAHQILKEIKQRLSFMVNVGLDYLSLDRHSATLSGGEAQRIRLATQIGAGLTGVLYILDEPSIGLHQRDNRKLLRSLETLRDLGNTLIVVEHDEQTIRRADYIIDLGPGAGKHGGRVVAAGSLKQVLACKESLTGQYLRGDLIISRPLSRRSYNNKNLLIIKGAREHNLKNIDVRIPLGIFVCVTGVSGSGKSTLIDEILYRSLAKKFYRSTDKPGEHDEIIGTGQIDKVIVIDQSPIGRTPRSNPATYSKVFDHIRQLFSQLPEAKMRGYKPGRFSFNVKGGRCEACQGDGLKKVEMHFLPDVYVVCEECKGKRYNQATLDIKYKGRSIAEILQMRVEDALELFKHIPQIREKLKTINDVGLGYVELGQSATTLSGGEAQRVKLSAELSKRATGRTLYILDEPTTGLHFADIDKLLRVLQALVRGGNTVLVIEHNLDVIKTADYIIDLGPEGGEAGGRIVAAGTPEEISKCPDSYTGRYLKPLVSIGPD